MTPQKLEELLEEALNPPEGGKPPRLRCALPPDQDARQIAQLGDRLSATSHSHHPIATAHSMMVLPCF